MITFKNGMKIIIITISLFLLDFSPIFAFETSTVTGGDNVILIKPMADGVTYYVRTSAGIEIWKDRDSYLFYGIEERCTVIQSLGSEILLYVPIMDAKYWFTVIKVGVKSQN